MSDITSYEQGSLEEKTTKSRVYSVLEFPTIEAKIRKPVKYIISGLHTDVLEISSNGQRIELSEDLTRSNPNLWEKLRLVFSLAYHIIFDKDWYGKHVHKLNYIKEDDPAIVKLREAVDQYNILAEQYAKIDGQVIIDSEETRDIEATPENLAELINKIEQATKDLV